MLKSFSPNTNREIVKLHLNIQGEEIVVRSPATNVDSLKKSAEIINDRLNNLHQSQPQIPSQKLSLMIVLQICFDNLTKNIQFDQAEKELSELKGLVNELSELFEDSPEQLKAENTQQTT